MIGTAAFGDLPLEDFVAAVDPVVAVDVADGMVRTAGWRESSGLTTAAALERCTDAGVTRILCTAVARDGTRSGPDLDLLGESRSLFDGEILAAGGIRNAADIAAVRALGIDGVVV